MFEVVHELALVGATLFMLAIRSIWYAPFAFGRWATLLGDEKVAAVGVWKHRLRLGAVFLVAELVLAYILIWFALAKISFWILLLLMALLVTLFLLAHVVEQVWTWGQFAAHLGFYWVWLFGSTFLLLNWPW